MPNAVATRDELTARYVLANAVETFVNVLAGNQVITWALDGTPFSQCIPEGRLDELDRVLRRMGDGDFEAAAIGRRPTVPDTVRPVSPPTWQEELRALSPRLRAHPVAVADRAAKRPKLTLIRGGKDEDSA